MNRSLKTMIVDDEEVSSDLLEIMLNRLGIREIVKATTGPQAIELFESGLKNGAPFALVFLDIIMPGMDGQAALKHLRAAEKEEVLAAADKAVIIMTTALTSTDAMIEALFDGDCNDYLVKPIGPAYLVEMLANKGFITRNQ
jgi:two-component system, chemotaxis family, chemotaxis protein CheY